MRTDFLVGAGAENQVEFFMERAAAQSLNFLENAQGIETLSAATV